MGTADGTEAAGEEGERVIGPWKKGRPVTTRQKPRPDSLLPPGERQSLESLPSAAELRVPSKTARCDRVPPCCVLEERGKWSDEPSGERDQVATIWKMLSLSR